MKKTAIITGPSSGLGRAIAMQFAEQGWQVVCSDLRPDAPNEAATTVDLIKQSGRGDAIFAKADVSKSEDIQRVIEAAVATFRRLDIMVNNAGIALESYDRLGPKMVEDTEEDTFDRTVAVNTRSVFLGCKNAIRQFMKQTPWPSGERGWIIITSSVYGLKGEIGHVSYCTSKAAVVHMTRTIAREAGPKKIHCNVICPGFIATGMDSKLHSDVEQREAAVALHPWGTLGEAQDVAKACVFLASENASWLTGVALPVDGGYMTA